MQPLIDLLIEWLVAALTSNLDGFRFDDEDDDDDDDDDGATHS